MKEKRKQEKAITLIALVITIIVLLILAGISIATLTGENGILEKAKLAKEETIKAEEKEALELIGLNIQMEDIINNLSNKEFMDRYEEDIRKDKTFEGANITRKDEQTIQVVTKYSNTYEVTRDKVEFIGKQGEQQEPTPPDLQESDITLKMIPTGWTNGEVKVEITTEIEGFTLQYSTDGITWNNYTTGIPISENGPIYTRLINQSGVAGNYATGNVTNIDQTDPTVSISAGEVTSSSAKLTVTASDEESGLAETGTYQYYLGNTLKETTTINSYTFTGLENETTYTLKVIVTDKVGNTTEKSTTITTAETVVSLKEGEYVNYIDKDGTTRTCVVLYNNSSYGVQVIMEEGILINLSEGGVNEIIDFYNNLISNLNEKANEYLNITYASSARAAGSVPDNPNSEASEYYTREGYPYFNDKKFKNADTNYETDYNQMKKLNIRCYLLASRYVIEYEDRVAFGFFENANGGDISNTAYISVKPNRYRKLGNSKESIQTSFYIKI